MPHRRSRSSSAPRSAPRSAASSSPILALLLASALFAPAAAVAQQTVLTRAHVVDVATGTILENRSVHIDGARITAITDADAAIPDGAEVIDLMGRYLAPGLIDAHVHVQTPADARRALHYGITTMRSMGTVHYADVGMRELQRAGHLEAPEYLAAGYHVRPPAAPEFFIDHPELGAMMNVEVRGEEAVRAMTRALVSREVDFVKTNATERAGLPETDPRKPFYSQAELAAIVDEAGRAGVPVSAHAHGDLGGRDAVLAGVASIEHGTYLGETTLRLMAERGTVLVPTIAIVRDLTIPGGDYDNASLNIRGRHMLPRVLETARMAHELGVTVVAATDTGYGPNSTTTLAHELLEFDRIGMTPLEALRAATNVSAEFLGVADRTGQIAVGLEADLIVLERNPLDDIGVVQDVLMVFSDGALIVQRGDWRATNEEMDR
jgi:imidazolonepropionase-like amidohydrolase